MPQVLRLTHLSRRVALSQQYIVHVRHQYLAITKNPNHTSVANGRQSMSGIYSNSVARLGGFIQCTLDYSI